MKRFWGSPKVRRLGKPKGVCGFCRKRGKLERIGGFFPGKTCELLFVRGTISFYNKKLQIFPTGEGAMWNVQM